MKNKVVFLSIGIITALLTLVGCGGNNIGENLDTTGISVGRLVISITDAPSAPEIDRVMLTITGLSVHMAGTEDAEEGQEQNADNGGWEDLELVNPVDGKVRFDLLELQSGLQKDLAIADLGIGKYTQIRMEVESVELDFEGTADDQDLTDAKLPSGTLKFIQPFELKAGQTTELLFDFDALKSVNQTGNGEWICKPVIKLDVINQEVGILAITTETLPNGVVNAAYPATTFSAAGGVPPYTWSLDTGNVLPASLSLVANQISGTLTTTGSYTFTIKVVDSGFPKVTATKSYTINIAGILQITPVSLPSGTQGTGYSGATLNLTGGTAPYHWTLALVAGETFPAGMSLSDAGVISGTPSLAGSYTFTVQVTDASNPVQTDTDIFTLNIAAP